MADEKEEKAPILILHLLDQQNSGWMLEGTEDTPNPEQKRAPGLRIISNRSVRPKKSEDGKSIINEKIRYIYGEPEISVELQDKRKVLPNPHMDIIGFKDGQLVVVGEGATLGLFNFMKECAMNVSNEKRIKTIEPIFEEMKFEEKAESENFIEFDRSEAIGYLKQFQIKKKDGYEYKENRIDALCTIFGVVADGPAQKLRALIAAANIKPTEFLEKAKRFEEMGLVDIQHAVELGVIEFKGTAVSFVEKNKVIKTFMGNVPDDKKLSMLNDFFQSPEGQELHREFKTELDLKKEKKEPAVT